MHQDNDTRIGVNCRKDVRDENKKNERPDQNGMSIELATQLLDELRLKVSAEQFADDLVEALCDDYGEEFADAVLDAVVERLASL